MLADPAVDIVLNLTRPSEHYAVTKAALLAGRLSLSGPEHPSLHQCLGVGVFVEYVVVVSQGCVEYPSIAPVLCSRIWRYTPSTA